MYITVLKSKLHRAAVTAASVDYSGSIGISRELMDAAGLLPYERVLVANITNGERFETYVIEKDEPGRITLNGAAARKGSIGDRLIIMSFAGMTAEEAAAHQPRIAVLDELNRIVEPGTPA
ncbi:aspartate 1-decarboxylase [bacterium]|nr:aspartate 1-decarboxylase [bacterium]